jgi:putative isomerase
LLGRATSQIQAERMVQEHLLNPDEFNGQWMLPSISMKDATFKDQKYWRGRIWGPMNFLVYLALLNYTLPEARKTLAEKSNKVFTQNINLSGYVFENYNGITGNITDLEGRREGDNYYH